MKSCRWSRYTYGPHKQPNLQHKTIGPPQHQHHKEESHKNEDTELKRNDGAKNRHTVRVLITLRFLFGKEVLFMFNGKCFMTKSESMLTWHDDSCHAMSAIWFLRFALVNSRTPEHLRCHVPLPAKLIVCYPRKTLHKNTSTLSKSREIATSKRLSRMVSTLTKREMLASPLLVLRVAHRAGSKEWWIRIRSTSCTFQLQDCVCIS